MSEITVKRLVAAGELHAIDVGRSRRVPAWRKFVDYSSPKRLRLARFSPR